MAKTAEKERDYTLTFNTCSPASLLKKVDELKISRAEAFRRGAKVLIKERENKEPSDITKVDDAHV